MSVPYFPSCGERSEHLAQRTQPRLEVLPLVDALAIDRAANLLGTRRVHPPLGLVEVDAGSLEFEAAVVQDPPHAAFEVVDDVLVLHAQDATGQHRVPMIHQAYVQRVIAPDVFEAVGELLS